VITLELANGKQNKFFTLESEGENRYYIEDFNAEETKGLNNVYLLAKEVTENSIVLDIGCAQGNFGKILKEKNCTVYGIDLDEKAIEYAKNSGYYDEVFIMDVTNKDSDEYRDFINRVNQVDAIVISDVFEHVVDPTKLLLESSKLLKEDGIILISVPNVAHMDILLNLMNDKFNYQDMGILDNTHLKFFTKTSFVDWIQQINETFDEINFDCEYLGATFYNNEFLSIMERDYSELFTILENSPNYNGLQILFKITKLSKDKSPVELKKLHDEPKIEVVKILGNALKGKINNIENHKPVEGQRLWYEMKLKDMKTIMEQKDKYIEELEDSVHWHVDKVQELNKAVNWYRENDKNIQINIEQKDQYIKELEDSVHWHIDKVQELNKAIEWHQENDKNVKVFIEQKESELEEQKNKYKQEILELRKKIFDMENTRSWRWTKFLRRGK